MKRTMTASALAAGLFCSLPALAQLPEQAAPQGMRQVATGGAGVILTSQMSGTRSAHKMLLALKMVSGEYFDKPLTVTRAFADCGDRNLQAAFTAKLKGIPVRGVVSVTLHGQEGEGTLLFDRAATFGKSFRTLVAKQSGGGGKAAPIKLTRQTAPDGSGAISLPPGFRITGSYQGTFDIAGPNGAYMGLGSPTVCTRPEAAAMFPGIPPLDFQDPVRAMLDYLSFMGPKAGIRPEAKILDTRPVQDWPNGRAAFIRYLGAGGRQDDRRVRPLCDHADGRESGALLPVVHQRCAGILSRAVPRHAGGLGDVQRQFRRLPGTADGGGPVHARDVGHHAKRQRLPSKDRVEGQQGMG